MYHEFLKILVVENKIIDYQYFMDEMQQYEVNDLMELVPWANKASYDQMRRIMWASLKPYLKDGVSPERLMPLYTDKSDNIGDLDESEKANINTTRAQILEAFNNGAFNDVIRTLPS